MSKKLKETSWLGNKGISSAAAAIIIATISITLVGTTYFFSKSLTERAIAETFEIVDIFQNRIIVRNTGTQPISEFKTLIDGKEVDNEIKDPPIQSKSVETISVNLEGISPGRHQLTLISRSMSQTWLWEFEIVTTTVAPTTPETEATITPPPAGIMAPETFVTFDRDLDCHKCGKHKAPPLTNVNMTISATVSSSINNSNLTDYYPNEWTVTNTNGGTVSEYNSTYNKIEWDVGIVQAEVTRWYIIKSPQRTMPSTKYYFFSEVADTTGDEWMVIVADPTSLLNSPSSTSGGWTNPTDAYADGGGYAYITSAKPSASQTYYGYGFNILGIINSVRVRYDAWTDGNEQIRMDVSWDGGTIWSTQEVTDLTSTEITYWFDVTSATSWTADKLNDTNFRVRVDAFTVGGSDPVNLDWIPVEVNYTPYGSLEVNWTIGSQINSTSCTESSPCDFVQYTLFTANATVTCEGETGASCGDVSGSIRYNDSNDVMTPINITKGGEPFFLVGVKEASDEWYNITVDGSPSKRYLGAIAYSSQNDTVILFGGYNSSGIPDSQHVEDDTWVFNFSYYKWYELTEGLTTSPPKRYQSQLTYSPTANKMVMFGGYNTADRLQDTWIFNSSDYKWYQASPTNIPTKRSYHQMVYDSKSDRVIMFGGTPDGTTLLNDTWEFNFTDEDWYEITATGGIPKREEFGMAYDSTNKLTILFGGVPEDQAPPTGTDVTWAFNYSDRTWTNLNPTTKPSERYALRLVYDSENKRIILYGGNVDSDETWTYDYSSNVWEQKNPATNPGAGKFPGMTYISSIKRTFLFSSTKGGYNNETWLYNLTIGNYPAVCGQLIKDGVCPLSWTVNATGTPPQLRVIDVNFTSSYSSVQENDTDDAYMKIITGEEAPKCSGTEPPVSGNWIITDNTICENVEIIMNGNVTIQSGGSLTFKNVALKMNSSQDGGYGIEVNNGGKMFIYDLDNNKETVNDASNITNGPYNTSAHYFFQVRANSQFEMKNSFLSECGYYKKITGWTAYTGLKIWADNSIVLDNTFDNNYRAITIDGTKNCTLANNMVKNSGAYGILLVGPAENNTVSDNTLINNYHNIHLCSSGPRNNTITRNNITAGTYGIYIHWSYGPAPSYNIFTYNNISSVSYGIYIREAAYHNVFANSSIKDSSTADYYLRDNTSTNKFMNMNWTEARTIFFYNSTPWFNYNNRTDIDLWLKTNVSETVTITRKLISWTQSLMQWNDSASTAVTARYNITGLVPNKYYLVYNDSVSTYTLQTDSNGNLPSFTIYLSGEHEIRVEEDTQAPQIEFVPPTPDNETTTPNDWVYLNTTIIDDSNTSSFIDWNRSLVGYWAMDYYNSTGIYDNSSYENFGTFEGINFGIDNITTGKYGYGLEFDGSGDYVEVRTSDSLNPDYISVEAWIKPASDKIKTTGSARGAMIVKKIVYASELGYWLQWNNASAPYPHSVQFNIGDETDWKAVTSSAESVPLNQWTHVVGTYNGSLIRIYINGVLHNSQAQSGPIASSTDNLRIGAENPTYKIFNGTIDEVKIWNTVLSPEEINASYNNGLYRLYHNFTDLPDGTYDYYAYAIDTEGNANKTGVRTVTVGAIEKARPVLIMSNTTDTVNTSGLMGYWRFDEGVGNYTYDKSGWGNDGTLQGSDSDEWISGRFGQALEFDGDDDIVHVYNSSSLNNLRQFTYCAWIYPIDEGDGGVGRIMCKASITDGSPSFFIRTATGPASELSLALFIYKASSDWWQTISSNNSIELNAWSHVCGSYDDYGDKKVHLYIDGIEVSYLYNRRQGRRR